MAVITRTRRCRRLLAPPERPPARLKTSYTHTHTPRGWSVSGLKREDTSYVCVGNQRDEIIFPRNLIDDTVCGSGRRASLKTLSRQALARRQHNNSSRARQKPQSVLPAPTVARHGWHRVPPLRRRWTSGRAESTRAEMMEKPSARDRGQRKTMITMVV